MAVVIAVANATVVVACSKPKPKQIVNYSFAAKQNSCGETHSRNTTKPNIKTKQLELSLRSSHFGRPASTKYVRCLQH